MNTEVIALAEILRIMDEGETFSIRWVKYDRKRDTGGDVVELKFAKKIGKNSEGDEKRFVATKKGKKVISRNPDHFKNFTRNIKNMANGKTIKIHCRLITFFNGKRVRY
ncbi:MAG: hypothetical protein ACKVPJ_13460 [Chitinophagales bacterium]